MRTRSWYHRNMKNEKVKLLIGSLLVLAGIAGIFMFSRKTNAPSISKTGSPAQPPTTNQTFTTPSFDKTKYSLTDPASIWVVVNKQHPLDPKSYTPTDLVVPDIPLRVPGNESMQVRKATATALEAMFAAAKTDGLSLMLSSGYRSYNYQVDLYGGYVKTQGQATADTQSARPGFSEHQTGLAADLEPTSKTCELDVCFKDTPEGAWVAANAYKYGFIIRYTSDKTAVTGYEFEPWHVRYIGTELATELHNTNVETLEEFFGVTGGTTY